MISTNLMYRIFITTNVFFAYCAGFSTQYYGNTQHAVLPAHCYYEDLDLAVAVNQTVLPININYLCAAITCRHDYVLLIKHCDRIMLPSGCRLTPYDYSKAYPDCCYKVVCSRTNNF